MKNHKSWLEKKNENARFKKGFDDELEKLSIGEQIAKMRILARLTQAQVAKRIGTTASAISRYENAEYDRYELRTLRKIAEACGGTLQLIMKPADKDAA
jgi:transcriptional regulator with XRE-family HTH domain